MTLLGMIILGIVLIVFGWFQFWYGWQVVVLKRKILHSTYRFQMWLAKRTGNMKSSIEIEKRESNEKTLWITGIRNLGWGLLSILLGCASIISGITM